QTRDANSMTSSGSRSLMPWLPDLAARGSPSRLRISKPSASRYARSWRLFQSGYGVATEMRRAPKKRKASTTDGLVATAGTPAARLERGLWQRNPLLSEPVGGIGEERRLAPPDLQRSAATMASTS